MIVLRSALDGHKANHAAGTGADPMTIEVVWRSGRRSRVTGVRPNRIYEVDESGAGAVPPTGAAPATPWFADVSALLAHRHEDEPFDEDERQPLLARQLSRLGAGAHSDAQHAPIADVIGDDAESSGAVACSP